jgi:hypothetical protein
VVVSPTHLRSASRVEADDPLEAASLPVDELSESLEAASLLAALPQAFDINNSKSLI